MKIWKEKRDPSKHTDWMSTYHVGGSRPPTLRDSILEEWQYFVRVCGFTFEFCSVEQISECLKYVGQKLHPSSRKPNDGLEHYWQRWSERLPAGLLKEAKRVKIVSALETALERFKAFGRVRTEDPSPSGTSGGEEENQKI
jgi:hypothetical protein